MPTITQPQPQVRHGVTWQEYLEALDERDRERQRYRLTFDRGRMEIMPRSFAHERLKKRSARLVEAWTLEYNIALVSVGEWTLKSEDAERGLEGDDCYYVQNVAVALAGRELSLDRDPPPDLALEIEISRSVLDRLSIYAALQVPEVWRIGEDYLTVCLLRDGEYVESETSLAFPQLPLPHLRRFLFEMPNLDETALIRAWVAWIRQHRDHA